MRKWKNGKAGTNSKGKADDTTARTTRVHKPVGRNTEGRRREQERAGERTEGFWSGRAATSQVGRRGPEDVPCARVCECLCVRVCACVSSARRHGRCLSGPSPPPPPPSPQSFRTYSAARWHDGRGRTIIRKSISAHPVTWSPSWAAVADASAQPAKNNIDWQRFGLTAISCLTTVQPLSLLFRFLSLSFFISPCV